MPQLLPLVPLDRPTGTGQSRISAAPRSDENANSEPLASPRSNPPALLPLSDFELFANDLAGRTLPVYGRQLFEQAPTTFAPLDAIPVPADYTLGPGDEINISVWGKIDLESHTTVDRNGQISLPKIGTLTVTGLRYEQLQSFLRNAIASLYKGFDLSVSLGQLRSIQILVLGSARQPGAYTVSSLSTLVNALFASGGPSATGSMRRIQLRRGNQVISGFDLYDLLRKGDKSSDVQLLPGDIIYIPPVGPQVAIVANVNEPGIYELKGETTLAEVVECAGGLTNLAASDRVLLERIDNHKRHAVDQFPLDPSGLRHTLKDGDVVRIFEVSPQFENAVTIRGNVAIPGRYVWHPGIRVSDLIPSREVLITPEHWNEQNHLVDPASTEIKRLADQSRAVLSPSLQRLTDPPAHALSRLTDRPNTEMMTDISAASSEINWDYAAIERLDTNDLSTLLIPFNLGRAIDDPSSHDNQELKPGDVVTVFSRKDLPLPIERRATFVRLSGELNAPGVYRITPGESLRNVVQRAGGLTPHSYLYASQLTRESTRRIQEQQLRLSIQRMETELEARLAAGGLSTALPASLAASPIALQQESQLKAEQDLIAQLGDIRPTGRVVLGLKPNAHALEDIPDFPLEDGDSFYIPPALGTVQVSGEVYNANAFRYLPQKRLASYLRDSGGPTRTADAKRIFLIRADGTVVNRQNHNQYWSGNFERLTLMPGDAIVIPPKLKLSAGFMAQLPLITQTLSQTAMTGAVVSLLP